MSPAPDHLAALAIHAVEDGAASEIGVRAQPGAKRSAIVGEWNGLLKICVRAPAQEDRANRELLSVLAQAARKPASQLFFVAGTKSRQKRVRVPLTPDALRECLERALWPDKS